MEFLPAHVPDEAEKADAALFAENVRVRMGEAAGLPLNPIGAKELRQEERDLQLKARASKKGKCLRILILSGMIELGWTNATSKMKCQEQGIDFNVTANF